MSQPSAGNRGLAVAGLVLLLAGIAGGLVGSRPLLAAGLAGGPALVALSLRRNPSLSGYAFTLWVLSFVAGSMTYPEAFRAWGGYPLSNLIVPLIQIIMFGMGTHLSLRDFTRVLAMPWPVLIGFVLHFLVMPLSGWAVAHLFGFEGALAAGVILVGAAPSGVASNVITYLAGGNVALSVTITACSTLAAPIMTPLAVKLLAGQYVAVSFVEMMVTIIKIIIVPIAFGLVVNRALRGRGSWMERALPLVSMGGICFIIAIITSLSRDKLLVVGFALIAAVAIHNGVGYLLGYWGSRLCGLAEADCRTVAIEVGMQNAGMASGLAISVLKSAEAALAPAIFGPWMNVSGSLLASWWRARPLVTPAGDSGSTPVSRSSS
ncbi:MAG: bile acid:sodium symporter family protein [Vicinamibacteria bacterium]